MKTLHLPNSRSSELMILFAMVVTRLDRHTMDYCRYVQGASLMSSLKPTAAYHRANTQRGSRPQDSAAIENERSQIENMCALGLSVTEKPPIDFKRF